MKALPEVDNVWRVSSSLLRGCLSLQLHMPTLLSPLSSTRMCGLAEWYCSKGKVLAVPGQGIQTAQYCVLGGLKVARSILDNVVCYGGVGLLTATLQVSLLNLSVLMCILMA